MFTYNVTATRTRPGSDSIGQYEHVAQLPAFELPAASDHHALRIAQRLLGWHEGLDSSPGFTLVIHLEQV